MDEYLGDQREYQKAVDDGFQGTYEEFLRMKSMREKAAYGGRIGYNLGSTGIKGIKNAIKFVKSKQKEIKPYGGSTKGIGTSTPKADVTPERNFSDAFSNITKIIISEETLLKPLKH